MYLELSKNDKTLIYSVIHFPNVYFLNSNLLACHNCIFSQCLAAGIEWTILIFHYLYFDSFLKIVINEHLKKAVKFL